jgi:hypothetical protein
LKTLCDYGWLGNRLEDFTYAARKVLDSAEEARDGVEAGIDCAVKLRRAIKAERARRG